MLRCWFRVCVWGSLPLAEDLVGEPTSVAAVSELGKRPSLCRSGNFWSCCLGASPHPAHTAEELPLPSLNSLQLAPPPPHLPEGAICFLTRS